jgi:regulator of replication initiation timing
MSIIERINDHFLKKHVEEQTKKYYAEYELRNNNLHEVVENLSSEIGVLKFTVEALRDNTYQLMEDKDELRKENERLRAQVASRNHYISVVEKENKMLKEQLNPQEIKKEKSYSEYLQAAMGNIRLENNVSKTSSVNLSK